MRNASPADFPSWIKSTDRRVQALERRGAVAAGSGGGGGDTIVAEARQVTSIITGVLSPHAVENATVDLGRAYRVYAIVADRACRIRFYTTDALRTADAPRPPGTDPIYEHGVMGDFVFTGPGQLTAAPMIDGFVPTGIAVPYAVENYSASASPVRLDITWIRTEGTGPPLDTAPAAQGLVFVQGTPATDWYIAHSLNFQPNITVVDSGGSVVHGDIVYVSPTLIHLTFSAAFSGTAYLS